MNIIILTNQDVPVFVTKEEMPKNENNNQFFVYEFKELKNEIDNTLYSSIVNAMGHYIKTELKNVFQNLDLTNFEAIRPLAMIQLAV